MELVSLRGAAFRCSRQSTHGHSEVVRKNVLPHVIITPHVWNRCEALRRDSELAGVPPNNVRPPRAAWLCPAASSAAFPGALLLPEQTSTKTTQPGGPRVLGRGRRVLLVLPWKVVRRRSEVLGMASGLLQRKAEHGPGQAEALGGGPWFLVLHPSPRVAAANLKPSETNRVRGSPRCLPGCPEPLRAKGTPHSGKGWWLGERAEASGNASLLATRLRRLRPRWDERPSRTTELNSRVREGDISTSGKLGHPRRHHLARLVQPRDDGPSAAKRIVPKPQAPSPKLFGTYAPG